MAYTFSDPLVARRFCSAFVGAALLLGSVPVQAGAARVGGSHVNLLAFDESRRPVPQNAREREALHVMELGNTAASEEKHREAIRYFERALGLVSDTPYWTEISNDLRNKLATSYERWFRVVGDPEDLRRALVYAEGYLSGLSSDAVLERQHAQSRVERLKKEINIRDPGGKEPAAQAEPATPAESSTKLVGEPKEVIDAPVPLAVGPDRLKPKRKLVNGIIATGSIGWLSLAGLGTSYLMYASRFDRYFYVYSKYVVNPTDNNKKVLDISRVRRDRWRYATLITGAATAASFAATTIMMLVLAKRNKKMRNKKNKLWAVAR